MQEVWDATIGPSPVQQPNVTLGDLECLELAREVTWGLTHRDYN